MDCHFTEEVSLLVDGELAPHEAARLRAHMEGCAACQQARESFMLLRQELRSYDRAPDPHVQSAALAAILNSPTSEAAGRTTIPRGIVGRLTGTLAEAFDVRRLRPAHVATLALLLIGIALGVRWFVGSRTSPQSAAPALANANNLPSPAVVPTVEDAKTPNAPRHQPPRSAR